jgi:hypothetical protein
MLSSFCIYDIKTLNVSTQFQEKLLGAKALPVCLDWLPAMAATCFSRGPKSVAILLVQNSA